MGRATQQDGAFRAEMLADNPQAGVDQAAEHGQIRGDVATLGHIEVFGEAV